MSRNQKRWMTLFQADVDYRDLVDLYSVVSLDVREYQDEPTIKWLKRVGRAPASGILGNCQVVMERLIKALMLTKEENAKLKARMEELRQELGDAKQIRRHYDSMRKIRHEAFAAAQPTNTPVATWMAVVPEGDVTGHEPEPEPDAFQWMDGPEPESDVAP